MKPELESTGEYVLRIAADNGREPQVFKAYTLEELCAKLAEAQRHGTEHIAELRRDLHELRKLYETSRDVAALLTSLLIVKGTDSGKAVDALIRKYAKDLASHLPKSK